MLQSIELAIYAIALLRVTVGALIGFVVWLFLNLALRSTPTSLLVVLVLTGAVAGLVWEMAAWSSLQAANGRHRQEVSAPVAFLGIAFIAGFWGALVASIVGITVALVCLLVASWLFGKLFFSISKQRFQVHPHLIFVSLASVVGFATPYAVAIAFSTLGN